MAKRGRPKKNAKDLLIYLRFGMTSAELKQLAKIADDNKVSVSYLMRAAGNAIVQNPKLLKDLSDV
jgi:hypothetical protein